MIDVYSIETLAFYLYNRAPVTVIEDVYGPVAVDGAVSEDKPTHPDYAREKIDVLARSFGSFWARLDVEHKEKLIAAAQAFADAKSFDPHASIEANRS